MNARDLKTGTLFISLANEHTRHNSAIFADMLLSHLKRFDVVPGIIQTDNGTEFVNTKNAMGETIFKEVIHPWHYKAYHHSSWCKDLAE